MTENILIHEWYFLPEEERDILRNELPPEGKIRKTKNWGIYDKFSLDKKLSIAAKNGTEGAWNGM